jgi:hypothetical protein
MTQAGTAIMLLVLLAMVAPAAAEPGFPSGWGGGSARDQDYDFGTAPSQSVAGKQAAYIKARPGAVPRAYFIMFQCIKADDYVGKRVRLKGRLKAVEASAEQLFLRVDGPPPANGGLSKVLSFYNMSDRPIRGTTDWKDYDVVLDVPAGSNSVCYGFLLAGGKGEAWADGFSLTPVGKDVPLSEVRPRKPVNLSFDQ